jgi:transposase
MVSHVLMIGVCSVVLFLSIAMGCGGVMDPRRMDHPRRFNNRWKRWSDMGVFARIMTGLAAEAPDHKTTSIDATYLKAHRTASSLRLKKGGVDV